MHILKITRQTLVNMLVHAPVVGKHLQLYRSYKSIQYPPGHYYSTIPDLEEVERNKKRIYDNETIRGIDLRQEQQYALLHELKEYYNTIPYDFFNPDQNDALDLRYKMNGAFYRYSDAVFLHCMMRKYRPKRIVEIGSGYSSAIMLDTNELFLDNMGRMTFVEPYPEERLNNLLRQEDEQHATVLKSFIQDIDPAVYTSLGENDILFVDSSHVSKVGSDVNFIFFDILPQLKRGVLIHFHDIFFPFELPVVWTTEWKWFWNENYILRAFLMNNPDYEIILFNSLLHRRYHQWFEQEMPACLIGEEQTGSIWIRKLR